MEAAQGRADAPVAGTTAPVSRIPRPTDLAASAEIRRQPGPLGGAADIRQGPGPTGATAETRRQPGPPGAARAPEVRKRPDPRPMRLGLGIGAMAVLSVMGAGLIRPAAASPDPLTAGTEPVVERAPARVGHVRHVVRYVQLRPGQHAPAGAKVINAAQPTPRVIVTRVAAPAQQAPRRRIVVTRTRQSGRP